MDDGGTHIVTISRGSSLRSSADKIEKEDHLRHTIILALCTHVMYLGWAAMGPLLLALFGANRRGDI